MLEKLKSLMLNDHIFYGLLVVLVGITSFGLGRASVAKVAAKTSGFELVNQEVLADTSSEIEAVNVDLKQTAASIDYSDSSIGEFVASKSGTKYHLPTCSGAKQIKPENKITFNSRQAAEAAGYKPAANCPELQ